MSSDWLTDLDRLFSSIPEWSRQYSAAEPFPHIVIDNFLSPKQLKAVVAAFEGGQQRWRAMDAYMDDGSAASLKKLDTADVRWMHPVIRQLIWELNSKPFIQFLQQLSSIPRLISDPLCHGGGLHEVPPGGLLKIHADFQKHPVYLLDRRINLILYLNQDWEDSFGGHLELWNQDLTSWVQRISPIAGRCVIFSTDDHSFHGHPQPLNCPKGRTRRSLALYYYSNGRDDRPRQNRGATHWQLTPGF